MGDLGTNIDAPYARQPVVQARALRYLERTGNADVAEALGLVADPVADLARRAKALSDMGGRHAPAEGAS